MNCLELRSDFTGIKPGRQVRPPPRRAGRRSCDTWLVERHGFVGGLAIFGLINLLLTLDDGEGNQVVHGLCQELVERLDARGAAVYPPADQWDSRDPALVEPLRRYGLIWGAPPEAVRYSVAFDPEVRRGGSRARVGAHPALPVVPGRRGRRRGGGRG